MTLQPILIDGQWRAGSARATFQADNPATRQPLPDEYPISSWQDCDDALAAATRASGVLLAARRAVGRIPGSVRRADRNAAG